MIMVSKLLCILVLLVILTYANCKNNKKKTLKVVCENESCAKEIRRAKAEKVDALAYLKRYGYLKDRSRMSTTITEKELRKALSRFQDFFSIPATGALDSMTLKYMKKPRCGVKDVQLGVKIKRTIYVEGSRWTHMPVTYRIVRYPRLYAAPNKRIKVDLELKKALKTWSDVTNLSFREKEGGRADIEIFFVSGDHGDGISFDGLGGLIGHSFYPQYGGDAHFDDDDHWSFDLSGTNLYQAFTHELGHSLGLMHSNDYDAVMYPNFRNRQKFRLGKDDILGIQHLYGRKYEVENNYPNSLAANSLEFLDTENIKPIDSDKFETIYFKKSSSGQVGKVLFSSK